MEEPYVERSYLNLDSDTEASLYTRNSRLRHSHWDESPPGSSRKVRAVLGGFAGNGLGTRFKEGISNLSRVKLYTLIAIIVIIVLGGVGGGVAAGIVTKRNNSTTNLSHLDPNSTFSNTSVQITSSPVPGELQTLGPSSSLQSDTTTSSQESSGTSTAILTSTGSLTTSLHTITPVRSTTSLSSTTYGSPICTTTPVLVTFREFFATEYGDTVKVVGNASALGDWNPVLAPTLYEQYTSSIPLWTISLFLTAGEVVLYEFIIDEGNGTYLWEDDCIYTTTVPGGCTSTVAITATTLAHQTTTTPPSATYT